MNLRTGYIGAVAAVLLSTGCYDSAGTPEPECPSIAVNASIKELHDLYHGRTFVVAENIIIGGYVTSSDRSGNFYRTFTICDASGGAEIMAGTRDLHNAYPIGCYVFVKVRGCAIGENRSIMQIGIMPDSFDRYPTDYFYSDVIIDRHVIRSGKSGEVTIPAMKFTELTSGMCGLPVSLCGMTPVMRSEEEYAAGAAETWAGYRAFSDNDGNTVYTYTSEYADFADRPFPSEKSDITGILQYGDIGGIAGEHFILKMRDETDCVEHIGSL